MVKMAVVKEGDLREGILKSKCYR